ncbi:MAG: glycosyltransferase family 4 protein [Sulfuricurvum sp.]
MANSHKAKIIVATNSAWYAYNFRLNLARDLRLGGYEVLFVAPYDKKYTKLLEQEFRSLCVCIDPKGLNPLGDLKTLWEFYQIYKQERPSVVLNYTIKPNIYSSLACTLLGISAISNITGLGTVFVKQSFLTLLVKFLYKISLSKNHKIFFQNRDDRDLFLESDIVDSTKIDVLPGSGVDLVRFAPRPKPQNAKFVFLFIARLIRDKGVAELVEASVMLSKKYTNFEVHLLGELGAKNKTAITKDELKSWLENDFIKYLGKSDKVEDEIAKAECIVLPSYYREGTPRSLLEAASMAKPIITTDAIGCRDVVDDGVSGFLCKMRDSRDLADKMEQMLLLEKSDLVAMGQAGRAKMGREYDEKIVIKKYLSAIGECLGYNAEILKV